MLDIGRKLPIGIQSFEKLREENFVYVDKTGFIYKIAHSGVPFFLSRPRRFGKSLFLSTLRAYWEGRKELFKGLAIEKLEENDPDAWQTYPVFYFDFNGTNYDITPVEKVLTEHLKQWEEKFGIADDSDTLGGRFRNLLIKVSEKTGLRCVILVDEYDKPLLDLVDKPDLQEHNKAVFKGFFSNLKSSDEYIRSVFITGVTKFHKVSIFSDLNQLNDISLTEDFSAVCGITEEELRNTFSPEVSVLAAKRKIGEEKCLQTLKEQYDGYRFCDGGTNVYNPASLLNAFFNKRIGSFWFETGTPTFLIKAVKNNSFDVRKFTDHTIVAGESVLLDYTGDTLTLVPLLYQTGYLTISDYNDDEMEYTLTFPNKEVKYGFLNCLMPEYVHNCGPGSDIDISTLRRYLRNGELDNVRNVLTALFARITYTSADVVFEHYFQTVIYIVFMLLGQYVVCEMHTFTGRIDCKVETDKYIYLFEFKRDESADAALKQIEDKSYDLPFAADRRKLYKIGVSFDSETRMMADWKVAE